MTGSSIGYDIREQDLSDGGVALKLVVEGEETARARATGDTLADMNAVLGLSKEAVVSHLREALLDALKTQGPSVEVGDIVEVPGQRLVFKGRFTHRLRGEVETGVVWYDVKDSTTGPETLPSVVRNKMRFEVHRRLTDEGGAARALVDLHK